ncbi:nitronate monooxygenase [Deferribacter abyssi]|uniref:nitronate monooxygenase n=1 Tax=Deferribacter abyssi TaxID=213806 RepID=UPI003C155F97
MNHPFLIQGGMGVGVSNWRLARAVSASGGLGVVSATALETILARRLQEKDEDVVYALLHFPIKEVAERIYTRFFGKKRKDGSYLPVPFFSLNPSDELIELTVAANFVEVFLAKKGHNSPVGINLLEKVQLTTLYSLYGAMLADVDYVIMGAGIPREIPGILDRFSKGLDAELTLNVTGASKDEKFKMFFSPRSFMQKKAIELKRPYFFAIVSSNVLATTLVKKSTGKVDGLVIENYMAGGHNAPPRVKGVFDVNGAPVYGEKDKIDFEKIKKLEVPFYLAGNYVTQEKISEALSKIGATGVQVGTIFALTKESGFNEDIKLKLIEMIKGGTIKVFADPLASPTGFPFKVAQVEGTLSDEKIYLERKRICNFRYLAELYKDKKGKIGYRCPAEPVDEYVKKGGDVKNTKGRKCLCNALLANIGYGNVYKNGYREPYLITLGDSVRFLEHLLPDKGLPTVKSVITKLKEYINSCH